MPFELSPLYPILDASYLPATPVERQEYLTRVVQTLAQAGVTMLQYRNKDAEDGEVLRDASWMRLQAPASLRILLNDRVHLVGESGCDGVHVGQQDMSAAHARAVLGPAAILGLSTHGTAQLVAGNTSEADYLAIGPVYATTSKLHPEPVVGMAGVRHARLLTHKPLVAIGGITLARAAEAREAGADAVAVISALFAAEADAGSLAKLAGDFLQVFR